MGGRRERVRPGCTYCKDDKQECIANRSGAEEEDVDICHRVTFVRGGTCGVR